MSKASKPVFVDYALNPSYTYGERKVWTLYRYEKFVTGMAQFVKVAEYYDEAKARDAYAAEPYRFEAS